MRKQFQAMDGAWQGGSTFSETTGIGLEKIGGRQKAKHVLVLEKGGSRIQHEQRTESEELKKNSAVQHRGKKYKLQAAGNERAESMQQEGKGNSHVGTGDDGIVDNGDGGSALQNTQCTYFGGISADLRSLFGIVKHTIAGITPMSKYAPNRMLS
jgi:hypothetical protein